MDEILKLEGISKVYSNGVYANRGVNFSVKRGEIHALVGENGAGKTTLMKIIFGMEQPDAGTITLLGKQVSFSSPHVALKLGIGMVHQHFTLVPSMTVAENIVLGFEPVKSLLVDRKRIIKEATDIAEKYDFDIDPKSQVRELPVGAKQKVEILKTLYRGAKVIILDEPTAVLTPQETSELFIQLQSLREQGFTIIFISHKLREIKQISDRVSVMRKGVMITTVNTVDVDEQDISALMIGESKGGKLEKPAHSAGENVIEVKHLCWTNPDGKQLFSDVNFSVRSGEILGVLGVEGNGQSELVEMITGLKKYDSGEICLCSESVKGYGIRQMREKGLSYIPNDRMSTGIAGSMTIEDNLITNKTTDPNLRTGKFLSSKKIEVLSKKLISEYLISCGSSKNEVSMLSGGNIQKVVVAREFSIPSKLIVAEQPTRGVDVGAAEFIHKKLLELRDESCAILLISADIDEVLKLSDNLIILYNGEIYAYLQNTGVLDENELGAFMLGVNKQPDALIAEAYHEK